MYPPTKYRQTRLPCKPTNGYEDRPFFTVSFLGKGSLTKVDYRKNDILILTSLLSLTGGPRKRVVVRSFEG